jgi:hypothetical protein
MKGTRIVQADSDSESRRQSPGRLPPVGTQNVLCLAMEVRIVVADAGGSAQTVGVRRFTGMVSSFLFPIQSDMARSDHKEGHVWRPRCDVSFLYGHGHKGGKLNLHCEWTLDPL